MDLAPSSTVQLCNISIISDLTSVYQKHIKKMCHVAITLLVGDSRRDGMGWGWKTFVDNFHFVLFCCFLNDSDRRRYHNILC